MLIHEMLIERFPFNSLFFAEVAAECSIASFFSRGHVKIFASSSLEGVEVDRIGFSSGTLICEFVIIIGGDKSEYVG